MKKTVTLELSESSKAVVASVRLFYDDVEQATDSSEIKKIFEDLQNYALVKTMKRL